jgi:hypothetical protein
MNEYLVGLMYHYPDTYELWNKGIVEDYEASTGLFITASSVAEALDWGAVVAERLLNHVHGTADMKLEQFDHGCWHEATPSNCHWSHCLDFFQHVACNQMPELDHMTTDSFVKWQERNA